VAAGLAIELETELPEQLLEIAETNVSAGFIAWPASRPLG
jgi:hypothetical protein